MSQLLRTDRDGVVELRLHRPEQRNALSTALLTELRDQLADVAADPGVRVVILTGSPPAFCAGADLRELGPDAPAAPRLRRTRLVVEVLRRLSELEHPTLAAVNGPAVGAGWGLALACDLCLAAEASTFSLPEVTKGFRLPGALVARLVQVVGPVRAAEVVFGGATYDTSAAVAAGWVTRVLPDAATLATEAWSYAARLAAAPRRAITAAKHPLRHSAPAAPFPPLELVWTEE